jgi:hypothetical protein
MLWMELIGAPLTSQAPSEAAPPRSAPLPAFDPVPLHLLVDPKIGRENGEGTDDSDGPLLASHGIVNSSG